MLEDALSFGHAFGHGGNARVAASLMRESERRRSSPGFSSSPSLKSKSRPTVRQLLDSNNLQVRHACCASAATQRRPSASEVPAPPQSAAPAQFQRRPAPPGAPGAPGAPGPAPIALVL